MKIMLDAGHGYNTAGKRSPDGMREYEFNRAVAIYAKSFFETYQNVTIYFAHSDDRDVPLIERTNKANNLKVDLYISIHANAYGYNWNDANGIETYVWPQRTQQQYNLAQKIQSQLIAETGLKNRGVKTADFHVLRETYMSAVLIECGFMTNPQEIKLLRSENYRRTCADAIVKAVAAFYGLTKKPTQTPPQQPPSSQSGLFKVQVGAFKQQASANELSARLKKAGFSNFVHQDKGLFKVQAGAFKDKSNADELVRKLKNAGFSSYVYRE